METLQIGAITKQVPSTWNEFTRRQLLLVLDELYSPERPLRPLRLLSLVTGFPLPLLGTQPAWLLAQLLPLIKFLDSEEHLLTSQLLPVLRIRGRHITEPYLHLHGPRESFRNLTFGEFIFADTFFVLYYQTQEPAYLDKFLAVLYRPARRDFGPRHPDWNGDVRLPFNEHQLELRARRTALAPAREKRAVLTWYRGCRQQLAQEYPDVFDLAQEAEATTPAAPPDWTRALRKLSGGAFGTVTQTAGQPLRLVLGEMQDAAAEYHRIKAKTATSHA